MVSGRLGGPIYDVVYRVEVPAAHVLVAGLTGSAGTDFDLYLFDASASTVLSPTGLLTKSIGQASNEQVSWPTRIGGTFYVDVNGATDVEGTYRLSVQVVPDPTPPQASLFVADGVTRTNATIVTLQLAGFDDLSGVPEMSVSYDGLSYLPPEPLRSRFDWTLSAGDGPKTIWVRVINGVGLASAPVSATVELDTTGPTVTSVTPADGATVTTARPTISVRFSEAVDAASWSNGGLVVQSALGGIVPGTYLYYPSTQTGTFELSADLAPGYVYFVTVADVRDLAGNRAVVGSWTLKRLLPASVTVTATPSVVIAGLPVVRLAGTVTIPAGASLALDAREGAATEFAPVRSITPMAGTYALTVTPARNTVYRVSYAGTATTQAASASVQVLVRRKVALLGPGSATTRTAVAGRPVTLTAQVGPVGVAPVSFQLYRYDAARGSYIRSRSFGRTTDLLGRARLTWTPSAGRWAWRVAVSSTVDYANNLTPLYRWSVGR